MPRWLPSQWHPLCLPLPCAGRWKQSLILCDRNEPLHWYPLISCTPPQWGQLRYQSIRTTPCNMTRLGLTHFTPYLPKKAAEWVLLKWDGEARRRTHASSFVCFQGQGLSRGSKTEWESNLGGVKLLHWVCLGGMLMWKSTVQPTTVPQEKRYLVAASYLIRSWVQCCWEIPSVSIIAGQYLLPPKLNPLWMQILKKKGIFVKLSYVLRTLW